ncbi:hypothetical protein ACH44C_21070 [Streptomyces purpureus]|uniref:hypothetical protein n=1 Tax=Streptomyces purpureus TaxID=1951 RepID=UPI00378FFDA7
MGATLLVTCVACTGGAKESREPSGTHRSGNIAPLAQLADINVEGDPFSHLDPDGGLHPLAEVRAGKDRLIVFTRGKSCGLLVAGTDSSSGSTINLESAWPHDSSEGSRRYTAGPYNTVSGAGSGDLRSWAEMSCSEAAVVVKYSSPEAAKAASTRGSVAVKTPAGSPAPLIMVVGSKEAQNKILPQAAEAGEARQG